MYKYFKILSKFMTKPHKVQTISIFLPLANLFSFYYNLKLDVLHFQKTNIKNFP